MAKRLTRTIPTSNIKGSIVGSTFQAVLQVQLTQFTNANLVAEGYQQQLNIDQENMYEVRGTHLTVGASTWMQGQTFNMECPLGSPSSPTYMVDVRDDQSDYSFGFRRWRNMR